MKFKLLLTLCILQFSNYAFSADKSNPTKKLVVGPRINKAEVNIDLKFNNEKLVYTARKDEELFDVDIDRETLNSAGNPRFIKQKKKNASGFVVDGSKFKYLEKISTEINEIYFFFVYEDKDKTYSLYYQMADKNGSPNAKPVKIGKRKDSEDAYSDSDYRNGSFSFGLNRSKSLVYVLNQASHKKINKKEKEYQPGEVVITYYDSKDMKELGSGTYDLSISKFGASAIFGDDGMVYTLVKNLYKEEIEIVNKKGKTNKEVKERYIYKVVAINLSKPENSPVEKTMVLKDKRVENIKIQIEENGSINCAGTKVDLDENNNSGKMTGFFTCSLNSNNLEISNFYEYNFEEGINSCLILIENTEAKYKIIGIEKMDNGSTSLLFEESGSYLVTGTNSKGYSYTRTYYQHGNLIVCNIGTNHKINWVSNLHKREIKNGSDFTSFYYKKFGNQLKFVFNDSKYNYDKTNLAYKTNLKSREVSEVEGLERIAIASIDEFGNCNRKLVENEKIPYYGYLETSAWSETNNEFYFIVCSKYNALYDPWVFCLIPPIGITSLIMDWQGKNQYYRVAKIKLD
jgi:hypothetical protein